MTTCPAPTTKQFLTMTLKPAQFEIPTPHRAYCHACSEGFASIDEHQAHMKSHLARHQGRGQ